MKLYEITEAMKFLDDIDPESFDELDAVMNTLDALNIELEQKTRNIVAVIRNTRAEQEAIAYEIKRLKSMKEARENKINRLRIYLASAMTRAGIKSVDCGPIGKARLQKGRDKIIVDDIDKVPDEYIIVDKKVNKAQISDPCNTPGVHVEKGDDILVIR